MLNIFQRASMCLLAAAACCTNANAERIANPIAVFNGLDKITGVTTRFEVKVKEQGKFGGLTVTPSVCYTRPITEAPKTAAFVQIDEPGATEGSSKRDFSGWMFAESPGLNGLEHPIVDIWLIGCLDPNAPPPILESDLKKAIDEEKSSSESNDVGEESDTASQPNGAAAADVTAPNSDEQTPATDLTVPQPETPEESKKPTAED